MEEGEIESSGPNASPHIFRQVCAQDLWRFPNMAVHFFEFFWLLLKGKAVVFVYVHEQLKASYLGAKSGFSTQVADLMPTGTVTLMDVHLYGFLS